MDVKRCDRCGTVYEADFGKNTRGTNFVLLIDRANIQTLGNKCVRTWGHVYEGAPVEVSDLCAECANDFMRWFYGEVK